MNQTYPSTDPSVSTKAGEGREGREFQERRDRARQLRLQVARLTNDIQYIDRDQFDQLLRASSPPLIVDVREEEEIAVGTLPNAVTLRKARELVQQREQASCSTGNTHSKSTQDVLCFCTVGFRSGIHALRLARHVSVRNVWNYSVMTHLWGGGVLVPPDGSQWDNRVHVYIKKYQGMMPAKFESVYFHALTAIMRAAKHIPALVLAFLPKIFFGFWRRKNDKM